MSTEEMINDLVKKPLEGRSHVKGLCHLRTPLEGRSQETVGFLKRSYESLVYIPIREMEPVKIYTLNHVDDRWFNSLLYRSSRITWEPFTDPEIVWNLKEGNPFAEEKDQYNIQQVD
jgi:hypothetical protein